MAMTQTRDTRNLIELAWGALLLAGALAAYVIYAQAFGAHWSFDDARVMEGLNRVHDFQSALAFALHDQEVGPLRRPIAMASFLLHQGDWPMHPSAFRHVNALLHVLNGLLLALVALRVARLVPGLAPRANGFAASLALVWLLHPLLASTSVMVIQRMTLLAGSFTLLAFLAYLHGRERLEQRPLAGYLWMSGGLVLGTLLGVLSKEHAVLTPVLVGVLEYTVLSAHAPVALRFLRAWRLLFFGLPLLGLALYAGRYLLTVPEVLPGRPFTVGERTLSETLILFEYVRQTLLPDTAMMGPFQDDTARIRGLGPLTLAAAAAWALLVAAAFRYRRRWPALSFAVLFFLAGHLLESTIFPLELYFEHRNYLPILGILGGLTAYAWSRGRAWPGALPLAGAAVLGGLLWQLTTLWAEPRAAARAWLEAHPTSTRAVQNLATQYQIRGQYRTASRLIVEHYRRKPRDGGLALMAVAAQCFRQDEAERAEVVDRVGRDAPTFYNVVNAPLTLHRVLDMRITGRCATVRPGDVVRIADRLLENPALKRRFIGRYDLFIAKARALDLAGDRQGAIAARLAAFATVPVLAAAQDAFTGLWETKGSGEALAFLAEARRFAPEHAEAYDAWEREAARVMRR